MRIVAATLSLILAAVCLGAGVPKAFLRGQVTTNLRGKGFRDPSIRLIGVAELAAACGLVLGLRFPKLGLSAAIGMAVLLAGAVGYHVRWGDFTGSAQQRLGAMPAVFSEALAVATVVAVVVESSRA